jgi:UMF2 family putative MFS family transporter
MIWVVVESALMCSGTSRNRGRLLAAYMMVYYVGTVLGQLMVSKLPTDLMSVLPWVTGMVLAAILPLLFTRIVNQRDESGTTHVWPMLSCVRRVWALMAALFPGLFWARCMA